MKVVQLKVQYVFEMWWSWCISSTSTSNLHKLVRFWAPPYVDSISQLMYMCTVAKIEYLIASFSSLNVISVMFTKQSPYIHPIITRWKQS